MSGNCVRQRETTREHNHISHQEWRIQFRIVFWWRVAACCTETVPKSTHTLSTVSSFLDFYDCVRLPQPPSYTEFSGEAARKTAISTKTILVAWNSIILSLYFLPFPIYLYCVWCCWLWQDGWLAGWLVDAGCATLSVRLHIHFHNSRVFFTRNRLISNKYVNEKKYITEIYLFFLFVWCGIIAKTNNGGGGVAVDVVVSYIFCPLAHSVRYLPNGCLSMCDCECASHTIEKFVRMNTNVDVKPTARNPTCINIEWIGVNECIPSGSTFRIVFLRPASLMAHSFSDN